MNFFFDPELSFKYRVLSLLTLNNKLIIVFFLNLYIKTLVFFKKKNKSKLFNIKKISDKHFEVNTEEGTINVAAVYRCLNLSSGLKWRVNYLVKSYGVDYFSKVFEKKNPVVIDIGANIGEFSIYCAKKNSRVFSIEHDKAVFPLLKLNMEQFFPQSVSSFNLSVSNKTGEQDIFYATLHGSTTIISSDSKNLFSKQMDINTFSPEDRVWDRTSGVTLDDFIDINKIELIDLIKCDAEGAEPEIIEGLKKNTAKVRYMTIDTGAERNGKETTNDVVRLLKERNFEILKVPDKKMGRVVIALNRKYI